MMETPWTWVATKTGCCCVNILQYMTVDCQNCDGDYLDLGCNKNWLLCEYFAVCDSRLSEL